MDMYPELKKIQKEHEYFEGVYFCFACDLVAMTLDDPEPLKDMLIEHKVLGKEDNISLSKVEDPASDINAICDEWHINEQFRKTFIEMIESADAYYEMTADGSYAAGGYLWSMCRVVQKDGEFVLLDFYLCD